MQLVSLKARACAVSTNDAVSSLFWCAMAETRGRPLPGQRLGGAGAASSAAAKTKINFGGSLGLALDLRRNGLQDGNESELFGNATWCLHVDGASSMQAAAGENESDEGLFGRGSRL